MCVVDECDRQAVGDLDGESTAGLIRPERVARVALMPTRVLRRPYDVRAVDLLTGSERRCFDAEALAHEAHERVDRVAIHPPFEGRRGVEERVALRHFGWDDDAADVDHRRGV